MKRLLLVIAGSLALIGCSDADHGDLRQWMEENTKDMRGRVQPLPEVKAYVPVPYDVYGITDPFRPGKIEPEGRGKLGAGKGGGLQPDFEARELRNNVLEKYPLESLTMIGRLVINKTPMAAIRFEDKVKQVKVGDYIGLDFGMVTAIAENEVKLRELVQDSAGEWSERESSLLLQSKEGSSK